MIRHFLQSWGWLPLICLLIAALALYAWHAAGADARALARDGIVTEARITGLKHVRASSQADMSEEFRVTVAYTSGKATDNTLELHEERRSVSEAFFTTLTIGQSLPIRILPHAPTTIEVEPGWVEGNSKAAGWVGLVFLILGLGLLVFVARIAATTARILDHGIPRQGQVTQVVSNDGTRILLFRWQGGDGVVHDGRSRPSGRASAFATLSPGDPIALLEDPQNPGRALLSPDTPARPPRLNPA